MNEPLRLRDLIDITQDDVERALAEQAKEETAVALVQRQLVGYAAGLGAEELNRALDTDVIALLVPAWSKVQAVRDAARRTMGSSERTVVTLGAHDVTSQQHPVLTLSMAQIPLPELRLTIDLVARFKSMALAVAGAAIRGLAPGEASVTARLRYRDVVLKEEARPMWVLPPRIALGDGVPVLAG
jgi:hypothetical protein